MNKKIDRAEVVIAIGPADSVVAARQTGKDMALEIGFTRSEATMIAAAISELARNIVQYAGRGEIRLRSDAAMLYVIASDKGPGIGDTRKALEPGYSTSGGLGLGLPGVQRIADRFEISSGPKGTTVTLGMKPQHREMSIEIGQAQMPHSAEIETGDRCVVKPSEQRALVAAIDGVGHGPEAAAAAAEAADVLDRYPDESLGTLMRRCHERLRETRGAAITLALLDARNGLLEWAGAGNIAAMLLHTEPSGATRTRELLVRGGIAGVNLPSIDVSSTELAQGDLVVLATDGLRRTFMEGVDRLARPQALAERLLTDYRTENDDALVVVARVAGGRA